MRRHLRTFLHRMYPRGIFIALLGIIGVLSFFIFQHSQRIARFQELLETTQKTLQNTNTQLETVKQEEAYLRNKSLDEEITAIETAFSASSKSYEDLIKLNGDTTNDLEKEYVAILSLLSTRNYTSASAKIQTLNQNIKKEQEKRAQAHAKGIPANVQTNNTPPGSGYKRQYVKNEYGTYMVDIFVADLNSVRVVVDTASEGSCATDCPVVSLGDYAGRSGALAAINGPYFCPADYPSCAEKKNSFDTLMMNKNKTYFNSDNYVYSTVPAVIFSGSSARFVTQSLQWGRDTGVDAVIATQRLLMLDGNVTFGGGSEIKRSGKGSRSFIGTTGSTLYVGVVHGANVAEFAQVLKTLGVGNALNLDSGGSTAFWVGGRYIVGPGRNLPFGIVVVGK